MNYYSLHHHSPLVNFKDATINGQAPDKGLYFPEQLPILRADFISQLENLSNEEIAFKVIKPFTGNTIPDHRLFNIVSETIQFPIPLFAVTESIYSLELYHGPTLAFKDIGARFMSRSLGYFVEQGIQQLKPSQKLTILVATSGDTGGAVASGFYGVAGVEVIILYPSGKVSPVQEKQLTTHGENIFALEVSGSFDDCQAMVKQAFIDADIREKLFLTSANSINVARWLPQQFYYFFAFKQWQDKKNPPVISVPSGNFGNICAGMLAKQTGLPVKHFIAACNANDIVPQYLNSSVYQPKTAVATISNAMDVGDPSNFIRILEIFHNNYPDLKNNLTSLSVTDEQTLNTIEKVFKEKNYLLDPHGAIGYACLENYLAGSKEKGLFLETAHPVKFPDAIERAGLPTPEIPEELDAIMQKNKTAKTIPAGFNHFKEFLLSK